MGLNPGAPLAGRYTLLGRIGRGGMSEVWRARDGVLGRTVAVKVLAAEFTSDPSMRAALRREAQAAAMLCHPHVTRIYDYGDADVGDGRPIGFLVMEVVEGQNLAERLTAGPLPWEMVTRIGAEVAAALSAAHAAGIVHRDVKPGNVMLTAAGAKVLDFGIAAPRGTASDSYGALLFGTPAYIAPERITRRGAHPAGDVYSLGALLYESLVGRPPLPITTWAQATAAHARHTAPAAPRIAGLPPELSSLVMACLAADPARRPAARYVAVRLGRAVAHAPATFAVTRTDGRASYPPTLVERGTDLLEPASRAAVPRVAGTARVVRRREPPNPPNPPNRPDPPYSGLPQRSRRSLLAVVGAAGAIVAAGLALTLLSPEFSGDPGARGAPAATASSPPASARPPNGTAGPLRQWSGQAEAVLAEIDRILHDAVAAGRVRTDVARDLRRQLEALREKLADGKVRDAGERFDRLMDEVRMGLSDGSVAPQTAAQLLAVAAPYAVRDDG
jgi:eukaryotic-like serine/threonine-protein kinase